MTTTELKQILQEIKDDCQKREVCQGCKFIANDTSLECPLNYIPAEWRLDRIGFDGKE